MFTEVFGGSPRVKLLDFLADHVDFDYTLSQMQQFTGISRPTLYRLVPELEKDGIVLYTREVGGSRFYRLNVDDPRVASMLQADFSRINEELAAGRFKEDDAGTAKRRPSTTARRARPVSGNET
jgi:DNA-binding transcriptional ArsR family regulator